MEWYGKHEEHGPTNGTSFPEKNQLGQLFDGPLRFLLPWCHLICQLPAEGEATGLDQQEGHRQRRRVMLRVDDVLGPQVVGPALPLSGPGGDVMVVRGGGVGEALVGLGGDLGEISKLEYLEKPKIYGENMKTCLILVGRLNK